jgi:hypothetical protein
MLARSGPNSQLAQVSLNLFLSSRFRRNIIYPLSFDMSEAVKQEAYITVTSKQQFEITPAAEVAVHKRTDTCRSA